MTNKYKIKFIDVIRFIPALLSIADNLAEKIHEKGDVCENK